jgi:hypothetical protein
MSPEILCCGLTSCSSPRLYFGKVHKSQESLVSLIRAETIESRIDLNPKKSVIPCSESIIRWDLHRAFHVCSIEIVAAKVLAS